MEKYQQVAQRLFDLNDSDRKWVIDQLSAADRDHVVIALAAIGKEANGNASDADHHAEMRTAVSEIVSPDPIEVVRRWDAGTFAALLLNEPIWAAALALSCLDRSRADSVLEHVDSPRREAMRQAFEQIERSSNAQIMSVISRTLIEKAGRRQMERRPRSDFESALERVSQESNDASGVAT